MSISLLEKTKTYIPFTVEIKPCGCTKNRCSIDGHVLLSVEIPLALILLLVEASKSSLLKWNIFRIEYTVTAVCMHEPTLFRKKANKSFCVSGRFVKPLPLHFMKIYDIEQDKVWFVRIFWVKKLEKSTMNILVLNGIPKWTFLSLIWVGCGWIHSICTSISEKSNQTKLIKYLA